MGEAYTYVDPLTKKALTQAGVIPEGYDPGGFSGGYGGGGGVDVSGAFKLPEGGFKLPTAQSGGLPDVGGGGMSGNNPIGAILGTLIGGPLGGILGNGGLGGIEKPFTDSNDPWMLFHKKEKANYQPVPIRDIYGDYEGSTSANGTLGSNFQLLGRNPLNSQLGEAKGLAELQTRATEKGPSAWAKMAMQSQDLDTQNMLNEANQAQAGQLAGARSGLAMRGGLRGGAAERLAASGQENALLGGQNIRNQGMQGRLGIGMQDENNKLNLLQQLPGAELSRAGYLSGLDQQNIANQLGVDQFNIGTRLTDLGAKNQWKKDLASGTIAATGAAQTASATENAGKK
jgi:hypothetical protein